MVKITCKRENNCYKEFIFEGHAGFDEKGKDIVCSAVSVLFINTFNSIEKFTNDSFSSNQTKDKIEIKFPNEVSNESKLLLDSLMLGLKETEKEYGRYLKITEED